MPILRGCCCFDLRVGTKIISIVHLIFSIFSFVVNGLSLLAIMVMGDALREALKEEQARNNMLSATPPRDTRYRDTLSTNNFPRNREYNDRFDDDFYDDLHGDYARQNMNNFLNLISENLDIVEILIMVVVIIMVVNIICSSCLIHGVNKNRRGFFLPWLSFQWFGIVLDIVCVAAVIALGIILDLPVGLYVAGAIGILVGWVFSLYLVLVVTSQYQAMGLIILREEEMSMK